MTSTTAFFPQRGHSRPPDRANQSFFSLDGRCFNLSKSEIFRLGNRRSKASHVFAGQRIGIKEVDEGIWIVSFMHYDLGYIDLEQKTLQPLDNPFGARLSPMS